MRWGWAVLLRHRFLWMSIEDRKRAGQWPSTCGLMGIQLGWHKGSDGAQISCSGLQGSSTLAKAGNCWFVPPLNVFFFLQQVCLLANCLFGVQLWCVYSHQPHSSDIPTQTSFCRSTALRSLQVCYQFGFFGKPTQLHAISERSASPNSPVQKGAELTTQLHVCREHWQSNFQPQKPVQTNLWSLLQQQVPSPLYIVAAILCICSKQHL